jgi:hypothetical protein
VTYFMGEKFFTWTVSCVLLSDQWYMDGDGCAVIGQITSDN